MVNCANKYGWQCIMPLLEYVRTSQDGHKVHKSFISVAQGGNLETIKRMLKKIWFPLIALVADSYGIMTFPHSKLRRTSLWIVQAWIEAAANISLITLNGMTPLHVQLWLLYMDYMEPDTHEQRTDTQ